MKLLADLKTIFKTSDQMSSEDILAKLHKLDESPWGDLKGKPLDARGLARRLVPYEVKPINLRNFSGVKKYYRREGLHDAWLRYLGPPDHECATSATPAPANPSRNWFEASAAEIAA